MNPNPTDDEISQLLAGESIKGPRTFRGRKLAPLTRTLRRLIYKINGNDFEALYILALAYAEREEEQLARYRELIAATDDTIAFRALTGIEFDKLTDAEEEESHRLVSEILGVVEKAETQIVQTEKKSTAPEVQHPTMTLLPSLPSPESSTAEVPGNSV